ncbi:MAG: hypothetical protein U9Q67_02425 [Patescibacteria group bacterium]|nr:hypothetical protein [Patescibacteria group bacterium]
MKIYFTCSTAELHKYRDFYFAIRNFLVEKEHILTRDWLPYTEEYLKAGSTDMSNVKEIYKECTKAITNADLVIIEDTVSNFSTGHQITLALQMRKPTLVLWKGRKHRQFQQMFIHGIDSDLLQIAEYDMDNFRRIITAFVNKYENMSVRNRFHLVLNNIERKYLDWAQFKRGKSRTKIIREALRKTIDSDEGYSDYLSGSIEE